MRHRRLRAASGWIAKVPGEETLVFGVKSLIPAESNWVFWLGTQELLALFRTPGWRRMRRLRSESGGTMTRVRLRAASGWIAKVLGEGTLVFGVKSLIPAESNWVLWLGAQELLALFR